jgi:putative acetyltransferase
LLRIRPGTNNDIPKVVQVHHAAVRALAGGPYPPEILEEWINSATPAVFRQQGEITGMRKYVAEFDGEIVAFSALHDSVVKALYVAPGHQRRKIAASLLRRMETDARNQGAKSLFVQSTLNALHFYQTMGFTPVKDAAENTGSETGPFHENLEKPLR